VAVVGLWVLAFGTAQAHAGLVPGVSIDGPSPDIVGVGGVALARDATGGVVYVRRIGGVAHVFVSLVAGGVWSAPRQVDMELAGPSSQPVIAAAEGGRVAICFLSGGTLYGSVQAAAGRGFTAPQAIGAALSDPWLSMGISGTAYVSFTAVDGVGADVRAARLDRKDTNFNVLPSPLNSTPASRAGVGAAKRSRVSVAGDGTGLVTWAEDGTDGRTHVHLRRVFGLEVSALDNDATLPSLVGHAGGSADSPDVGTQYDSSFGWLAFRQAFDDSGTPRSRVVVVALVGSALQPPTPVDSLGFPAGDGADAPRIAIDGAGDGLVASELQAGHNVIGAVETGNGFNAGQAVNPAPAANAPAPVVALSQKNIGLAAWQPDTGSIQAREFDDGTPAAQLQLSRPDFGQTDAADGLAAAADAPGDVIVGFPQGDPANRRVVVAADIVKPANFTARTTERKLPRVRVLLQWRPAASTWSPPTYTVELDGVPIATTAATQLPVIVPPGTHHWRVVATDAAGQTSVTPLRRLQVASSPLQVVLSVSSTATVGVPVRVGVHVHSSDRKHRRVRLRTSTIDFGDQTPAARGVVATHAYAKPGTYRVLVTVSDVAGRSTAAQKFVHVVPASGAPPAAPSQARR
jgi:hypothetical protein